MSAQLSQTRRLFDAELVRREQGGYRATASGAPDWRAEYERERVRLAKLLVLYRDLQDEVAALRERVRGTPETTAAPSPRPRRPRRTALRRGPFELNGYTLYRGAARGRGGATRRLYFFARRRPKSGRASQVPAGFEVRTTPSGLPVLRRTRRGANAKSRRKAPAQRSPPAPGPDRRARTLAYAREMRTLRARARRTRGGKGPIASRPAARRLRAKYGIN